LVQLPNHRTACFVERSISLSKCSKLGIKKNLSLEFEKSGAAELSWKEDTAEDISRDNPDIGWTGSFNKLKTLLNA